MAKRKLTPKQQVLKRWPNAVCAWSWGNYVVIRHYRHNPRYSFPTQKTAWADAARHLKGGR